MMRNFLALAFFGFAVLFAALAPVPAHAQAVPYTDLYDFKCLDNDLCHPSNPGVLAQGTDGNVYGMACDLFYVTCANAKIFVMTPQGNLTILYAFDNVTNGTPGLTLGPDGNFYGVTAGGGDFGYGTIFKVTPGGAVTTLHSFSGNDAKGDGFSPVTPPVVGDDGSLYGTATNYGYKIDMNGKFTRLTSSIPYFSGAPTVGSFAPLLLASDGNFYGTVPQGNTNGGSVGGTVFRMSPGGAVTVLYSFQPDDTGINFPQGELPYGGLAQGTDGNLYGTAAYGAFCTFCGVVFQMTPGGSLGWEHLFTNGHDGSVPQTGLVAASDGQIYGVTSVGGYSGEYGTFFSITDTGAYAPIFILTADCSAGSCIGSDPEGAPMQATSGVMYGTTKQGGAGNQGVFYSLNVGLVPFISTIQPAGKTGDTIGILGNGFNGASQVKFFNPTRPNGVLVAPTTVSDTYLTVKIPALAKTGPLSVVTGTDNVKSLRNFRVRVTTTTKLASSGSPSQVGQPVTFTATVTTTSGTIPDGELVTFSDGTTDGTTNIGSGTTVNGVASFTTSSLPVKTHAIKATYEGDGALIASTGSIMQVVNLDSTSTTLSSNVNPSAYGQAVMLTAVVSTTGSSVPTGKVTFKNGATSLGTATLDSTGTARLSTSKLPAGLDSITASYGGDSLNGKSTSTVLTQTVNPAQLAMILTSMPNPSKVGKAVRFLATLTSNGSLPNGQIVTFTYNGTALGTATIVGGRASLSTTQLPAGSDPVTASYGGDANHGAASAMVTQTVN